MIKKIFSYKTPLLIILILATIIPRIIQLNLNIVYFEDEVANEFIYAQDIVENHHLLLVGTYAGGTGDSGMGLNRGPLFNYLLVIPYVLGQGNPYAGKLFMFFISVLGVGVAFYLLNKIFGEKIAYLSSLFLALSPSMIQASSRIGAPDAILPIILLLIYSFYKILEKKYNFVILLGILIGILMSFEIVIAVKYIFFFILIGSIALFKKSLPIKYFLLTIISFILTQLPVIVYEFLNDFKMTKALIVLLSTGHNVHGTTYNIAFYPRLLLAFDTIIWMLKTSLSPQPLFTLLLFIFLLFGFYQYTTKNQQKYDLTFFLFSFPLINFFLLLIYPGQSVIWWVVDLIPIVCILTSVFMYRFIKKGGIFKILILIFLIFLFSAEIKRSYITLRYMQKEPSLQIPYQKTLDKIFRESKGDLEISFLPDRKDYQYMLSYFSHKYRVSINKSRTKVYFLIIETDFLKNNKQKDFSSNADKLVEEDNINNYIIQKRERSK